MQTFKSVALLSLLLLPACGQQLVEFADENTGGGSAGFAGTHTKGGTASGIAGARVNGGVAGISANSGFAGNSANGGFAGTHANGGSGLNGGNGGIGASNVNGGSANGGTSATGGTAGIAGTLTNGGSSPNGGTVGTAGAAGNSNIAGTLTNGGSSPNGGTVGTAGAAGNSNIAGHAGTAGTAGMAGNSQTIGQLPVPLGAASPFAILASAAITNIPTSAIFGDVGLTPDAGSNISGFNAPLTCPEVTGTIYAVDVTGPACAVADPVRLTAAKTDAGVAFTNARAAVRGTPQAISGNLNGLTLYPGLYESGSSLQISPGGMLYLDAQGNGNATFIIRSATSITTEATSQVILTNGAKANNVYWTAGSAVTLGTNSIMKGTLIAGTAISLLTGANLEGRALNQGTTAAAITLDSCSITVPSP